MHVCVSYMPYIITEGGDVCAWIQYGVKIAWKYVRGVYIESINHSSMVTLSAMPQHTYHLCVLRLSLGRTKETFVESYLEPICRSRPVYILATRVMNASI